MEILTSRTGLYLRSRSGLFLKPHEVLQANPKFGLLYNLYVALDYRKISSSDDWQVPTYEDCTVLRDYGGTPAVNGNHLKEAGLIYWNSSNQGDNLYGFNGRGSGKRYTDAQGFYGLMSEMIFWTQTLWTPPTGNVGTLLSYSAGNIDTNRGAYPGEGQSIRLVRKNTVLTHGQTGTYLDNDGYLYPTVGIGNWEWLAQNLKTQHFRNGDFIPDIQDQGQWAGCENALNFYGRNAAGSTVSNNGNLITHFQQFTLGQQKNLNYIRIPNVYGSGTPGFNVRLSIHQVEPDGSPGVKIADSLNLVPATSYSLYTFHFGRLPLSAGRYCWATSYENVSSHDSANRIILNYDPIYVAGDCAGYVMPTLGVKYVYTDWAYRCIIDFSTPGCCAYNNNWANV